MNILVINGSPKGDRSNSLKLTAAFLDGIKDSLDSGNSSPSGVKTVIRRLDVQKLSIASCLGCFSCWNKTPGKCVIEDDMNAVIKELLWADLTIWSFPLYYFGLPGKLKMLMDRQLPMALPFMTKDATSGGHPSRYDRSGKKTVLISTCGFYTAEGNYNAVRAQFDRLCGSGGYTAIFCGEGELFSVPTLKERTDQYLYYVRTAGREYVSGGISPGTREKLSELLYPRDVYERMADASWGIDDKGAKKEEEPSFVFTAQMAALYNPSSYTGKDVVFDMDYTDIGKRWQVILGKEKSTVTRDCLRKPDTVIHTPFSVWKDIAAGKYEGSEALMKHLYTVEGDFSLMLGWDTYFSPGGKKEADDASSRQTAGKHAAENSRQSNMLLLLLPWCCFWPFVSIESFYGSILSIALCAVLPVLFYRNRKTVYDVLSCAAVSVFSLLTILGIGSGLLVALSYFAFGLMWFVSVFLRVPLTAEYSQNSYGGEKALSNPMFMKTNRILSGVWGILYMITPLWTWPAMQKEAGSLVGVINTILPAILGLFTAWFQKWYPRKIAAGRY